MNCKKGLSVKRHKALQARLSEMANELTRVYCEISNAYPKGPRAPVYIRGATRQLEKIEKHLLDLRVDCLENQFFAENPDLTLRDLHGGF